MIRPLILFFSILLTATALAQNPPGKGPAKKITIEFAKKALAESECTPQGELKAILEATATLKTGLTLRYRSASLPPGAYSVRIVKKERDEGGSNLYFLIGPEGPSTRDSASTRGGAGPEEKKSGNGGEEPKKEAGSSGSSPGADRKSAGKPALKPIRALFRLKQAKKSSPLVEFQVQPNNRGDRLRLMVKAGSSQGLANLRIAD